MKIYAEIYPSRNLETVKQDIKKLVDFDGFNIPDNPLGYPTMPPELIGYMIREMFQRKEIILNQRLKDINELKLRSVITAARAINASIIFTQGDMPRFGREFNEIGSLNAMRLAIKRGVESGVILSFRKPLSEIKKRMDSGANIFLVVNFGDTAILDKINTEKLVPYIIVRTEKNGGIVDRINQPSIELKELHSLVDRLRDYNFRGFLFSVPGDTVTLTNIHRYM
jgi:5,10-methylenetetrahydrofolate reductase